MGDGTSTNEKRLVRGPSTPLEFAERDRIAPLELLAGYAGTWTIGKELEKAIRNKSTPVKPAKLANK